MKNTTEPRQKQTWGRHSTDVWGTTRYLLYSITYSSNMLGFRDAKTENDGRFGDGGEGRVPKMQCCTHREAQGSAVTLLAWLPARPLHTMQTRLSLNVRSAELEQDGRESWRGTTQAVKFQETQKTCCELQATLTSAVKRKMKPIVQIQ